jgi:segregation and condensation protein A
MLAHLPSSAPDLVVDGRPDTTPDVIDGVAFARLYGEPLFRMPTDLYIPPDALEVFLEAFEGPLDLLLYLIRKQNFNILDIPMAQVTKQYLLYVDQIRLHNLELAAEYLLMAAMLIEIKSRMLLPVRKADTGEEAADPRAELVRRLLEYEQMKLASQANRRVAATGPRLCAHAGLHRTEALWCAGRTSTSSICKAHGLTCSSAPS